MSSLRLSICNEVAAAGPGKHIINDEFDQQRRIHHLWIYTAVADPLLLQKFHRTVSQSVTNTINFIFVHVTHPPSNLTACEGLRWAPVREDEFFMGKQINTKCPYI